MRKIVLLFLIAFGMAQGVNITQEELNYLVSKLLAEKTQCANQIIEQSVCESAFLAFAESYKCYKSQDILTNVCKSAKKISFSAKYYLDSVGYVPEEEDGYYNPHFRFVEDILNLSLMFIAKKEQRDTQRFFIRTNWVLPQGDNNNKETNMLVSLLADYINSGKFGYICSDKEVIAQNPKYFSKQTRDIVDKYATQCINTN